MLEMIAVTVDGAHGAEHELSTLRSSRNDPWLSEVSIIEHDKDGRYSVKAKNPDVEDHHAGKGAAIGAFTGVFIGAIGGPFGLVLWAGLGTLAGGLIGAEKESTFLPMVDGLKAMLGLDASLLVLVGETPAIDALEAAVGASSENVLRQPLTNEQARELSDAA